MSRQPSQEAWTIDQLNSKLMINLGLAIDQSTHESYSSALKWYLTFCCLHGFDIEPTQWTLTYYVTFQSSHIDPKSVDSYLSGICNQLESHFLDVQNFHKSSMVSWALKGAKCCFGKATSRKLPLTVHTWNWSLTWWCSVCGLTLHWIWESTLSGWALLAWQSCLTRLL